MVSYILFPHRYGDLFAFETFRGLSAHVCDLDAMQEMLSSDAFSSRFLRSEQFLRDFKGGHGLHGLILNGGY